VTGGAGYIGSHTCLRQTERQFVTMSMSPIWLPPTLQPLAIYYAVEEVLC
jgi:hypothetical protein